ncbi:MAG: DUF6010 family protein, partial [Pseudomonadota bacterium]
MTLANLVFFLLLGALGGWLLVLYAFRSKRNSQLILAQALVIAALIYLAFALIWANPLWIGIELLGVLLFSLFAWRGVRGSMLWLAAGWGLHPFWDAGLHWWIADGHFAPRWYVIACLSFDLVVAA